MTETVFDPSPRVALELELPEATVRSVVKLLAEGGTVPFIARYRKEQTDGADEVVIRAIEEKAAYVREIVERRKTILTEIEGQGKLTPELAKKIESCWTKSVLEDLYLPYKPKRRTRAMIAKERGLEPLALRILEQPTIGDPEAEAGTYVDASKEVADVKAALAGARDIVAETIADRADVRTLVRETFAKDGIMAVTPVPEKTKEPTKFETYYDFNEKIAGLPSHRYLAIRRGESEGVLRGRITVDEESLAARVEPMVGVKAASPFAPLLRTCVNDALTRLTLPTIETDVRVDLKMAADRDAVQVFAENLKRLLLQPALGRRVVLGIDPGQRTGCKCVVVDDTGKLLEHTLVNLVAGESALMHAKKTVTALLAKHTPYAIAVGNGTHGRETADFCRDLLKELGKSGSAIVVMVSESGASVYSESDVARDEFPDLDLTVRGAISIARRLQDPLAELVKVDPKAIGVGQYQHDVFQGLLKRKLEEVVESCVNAVGVELNTASAPLLAHVAGVGATVAKKIVQHREAKGAFTTRKDLLDVAGLGPRTFEQCAGFVRIRGGKHPLDGSAVHPERYELVTRMATDLGVDVGLLVGNAELVGRIPLAKYVDGDVGMPTLEDIKKELLRPGRDPRDAFEAPAFRDDVRTMADLQVGMELSGVVTNVTAFGAFVDVGVHQDGLVHVSQLSDKFVKDPHEAVKVGDTLKVKVLEVDLARKRISLTAKSGQAVSRVPGATGSRGSDAGKRPGPGANDRRPPSMPKNTPQFTNNPFASLLKR
ncbi:MAG: Tex family protein [Polyangiaceae bacterium]